MGQHRRVWRHCPRRWTHPSSFRWPVTARHPQSWSCDLIVGLATLYSPSRRLQLWVCSRATCCYGQCRYKGFSFPVQLVLRPLAGLCVSILVRDHGVVPPVYAYPLRCAAMASTAVVVVMVAAFLDCYAAFLDCYATAVFSRLFLFLFLFLLSFNGLVLGFPPSTV